MVTVQHRIKRLSPDTVNGEVFMHQTIFTSYNKAEIDWIEKQYKDVISDGLIQLVNVKEQDDEKASKEKA